MRNRDKIGFRAATVTLILLILGYYVWIAATNGAPLLATSNDCFKKMIRGDEIDPQHYGYYNLLADSFLAGKLALLVEPVPELLQMPDPYDRAVNPIYRLHDASLYKGHYYLYFGPVPALFLFVPFRFLTSRIISEPFAVALFGFGAFFFATLILLQLARSFRPLVSRSLLLLAILALGISNTMPFLLRRPVVYEVAISAGAFFIMAGFFFLVRKSKAESVGRYNLLMVSLCWGLSVGCRPVYVLAGVALGITWMLLLWKNRSRGIVAGPLYDALCLGVPFALCLFLLGLYNWMRFDSWTEFGVRDQLAGVYPINMYRFKNIITGLYLHVLRPPLLDFNFPFFHFRTDPPLLVPGGYSEIDAGFLVTSPIVIALCVLWRKDFPLRNRQLIGLMAGFGLSVVLFETFLMPGVSMRYQVDFIFPILLAALLVWLSVDSLMPFGWFRKGMRTVSVFLICFGMIVHLAFGLTGYYDLFKHSHPRQYFACEDFFSPVSRLLLQFSRRDSPGILDAFNLGGSGTMPDQTPFEWVGSDGHYIRFFSPNDATYRLTADFFVNHAAPDMPGAQLRLLADRAAPNDNVISRDTHLGWTIKVNRGVHRIELFAFPLGEEMANVDAHQLLLMARYQLVDMVTGQEIPNVKR